MAKTAARNVVVVVLGVAAYWLLIRYLSTALDWLGVAGGRLLVGLVLHLILGAIGAVTFAGTPTLRACLVFLCVLIYGVLMEVFLPDPRHMGAQLLVSIPFATVAAVASLVWSGARHKTEGERHV